MVDHPGIFVLAGPNGAGKSSVGGEVFTRNKGAYFNPDTITRDILRENPGMSLDVANATAWNKGFDLLGDSIRDGWRYAFETTLGGRSVTEKLLEACANDIPVYIWFCALATPELHIQRVASRVTKGGHDIPEKKIRERYQSSRENSISLMPFLAGLKVYDNSLEYADKPAPLLLLSMKAGKVEETADLATIPAWAKSIIAGAAKLDPAFFGKPEAPTPRPRLRVVR